MAQLHPNVSDVLIELEEARNVLRGAVDAVRILGRAFIVASGSISWLMKRLGER